MMMKRTCAVALVAGLMLLAGCAKTPPSGQTPLDPGTSPGNGSPAGQPAPGTQPPAPPPDPLPNPPQPAPPSTPAPTTPPLTPVANCPTAKNAYTPGETKACIGEQADAVIQALKQHDMAQVATFVHPTAGLQFGLEGRIQNSPTFSKSQVQALWTDPTEYLWGHVGGQPTEVKSSFQAFYPGSIYHQDFANAPVVSYGKVAKESNSNDTVPAGQMMVDYHFPGFDPKYDGMDWTSLRLYFAQHDGQWYLLSVISDNWKI
jgi:hypothetical protein